MYLMTITKLATSISVLFAFISITAVEAAEYQFRQKLDDTHFASQSIPDPKPPVVPDKPSEPEDDYDISPYQNMLVTASAGNEWEYEVDPSFSRAMNKDIIAKQSNIFSATLNENQFGVFMNIKDAELEKHIKGVEIITSDNVKHVCNSAGASGIDNTSVWCMSFTPYFDNKKYMTGAFSKTTYTISFTK